MFVFLNVLLITIQMCLQVFIKKQYAPFVDMVQKKQLKTGGRGLTGNKGGICISFDLYNTTFFFINCHLAAGVGNAKKRNGDFYKIMKSLKCDITKWEATFEHDYLFFFGDLNYRTVFKGKNSLPLTNFNRIVDEIEDNNLAFVKKYDQFTKQKLGNKIFAGFKQGEVKHVPSYRREREKNGPKARWSNKKDQQPSWTDRILVHNDPNKEVKILDYTSRE